MTLSTDLQNILNQGEQIEAFLNDIPKHHNTLSIIPTLIGCSIGACIGTLTVDSLFFSALIPAAIFTIPVFKVVNDTRNTNAHKKLFRKHDALDDSLKTKLLKQFKPRSLDRDIFNFFTMNVQDYERPTKINVIKKASNIIDSSSLENLKNASTRIHSTDFWQYINSVLDTHIEKNRTLQKHKDEQRVIERIKSQLPDLESNTLNAHPNDGMLVASQTKVVQVDALNDTNSNDLPNEDTHNEQHTTKKHSI